MNRLRHILVLCVVALTATGCMSIYKLPAGAPSTVIEVPKGVLPWICANTEPQRLVRNSDGKVLIPTGERVVIGANFASSDGYMNYFCSASASVVPSVEYQYYQDFEIEGNYCAAILYRKAPDNARIGLIYDPTILSDTRACRFKKK
jgi:hypothetical protein